MTAAREALNRSRAMFAESAESMLSLAADLCDQWESDLGAGPAIAHLNDVRHGIETAQRAAAKVSAPGITVHGFPVAVRPATFHGLCDDYADEPCEAGDTCTCHATSERFAATLLRPGTTS